MLPRLVKAIKNGNIEEVKIVYETMVNTNEITGQKTADVLMFSLVNDRFEIFEYIIDYTNFDVDYLYPDDGGTLLMKMLNSQRKYVTYERIMPILKHTKDINIDRGCGYTALIDLIMNYQNEKEYANIITCQKLAMEFLDRGADAFLEEKDQPLSPISLVVEKYSYDMLKIFIEHSHVYIASEALRIAVLREKYDHVEYLLNYVNDLNYRDYFGRSLLEISSNQDIIELLTKNGVK